MTCVITDAEINGENLDASGVPTSFELHFRVGQCERVDVKVYEDVQGSNYGPLIYQALSVPVTGPADPTTGLRLVVLTFTPKQPKSCDDTYHVVIECTNDRNCRFEGDVTIHCKDQTRKPIPPCSPTATLVVRNSSGTEIDLGQSCLAQDTYSIDVVSPWSGTATAQWTVTPLPASGGSSNTVPIQNANGRQLSYVLPDQLQPPDTGRTIGVVVVDNTSAGPCISQATVTLPAVHPVACPTTISLELRLNNQLISPASNNPPTYTNLTAGFYELIVTAPTGPDVIYDWFAGGVAPAQSGASNSFGFNLAASNSPRDIEVYVRAGDCCPALRSSVTLTTASSTTPQPGGTGTETPGTPDAPGTPGGTSLCGIIRALAALALVVLFVSVMFVVCPSILTPVAVPLAASAAVAAAVLLALAFALCGLNFCGFWGIVIWALRWSIVLGVLAAIIATLTSILFLPVLMCVLLVGLGYGVICGMLIVWITRRGCTIPGAFLWP